MLRTARAAMQLLDLEVPVRADDVSLLGRGAGVYGYTYPATIKAIWKVAQTEGVFLDPVYTGTGMAELLRWAHAHRGDSPLVFLHTGGVTALFAYERELVGGKGASDAPGRRISRLGGEGVRRRKVAQA